MCAAPERGVFVIQPHRAAPAHSTSPGPMVERSAISAANQMASATQVRELLDRLEESLKHLPRSREIEGLVDAVIRLRGWMNEVLPE